MRLSRGQRCLQLLKACVSVYDSPEITLHKDLARNAKFGVTQILDSDPCCDTEQNNDQTLKFVQDCALEQRESSRKSGCQVQENRRSPRSESTIKEFVMNMT